MSFNLIIVYHCYRSIFYRVGCEYFYRNMSIDLKKYLENPRNILVLDGGCSTQISNYVSERVDGNPLWCSAFLHTDPEAVKKTHLDYLRGNVYKKKKQS